MPDVNLWPYNLRSLIPDPDIDWPQTDIDSMTSATPRMMRLINRKKLLLLKERNQLHWEMVPPDAQEAALAIIEGRKPDKVVKEKDLSKSTGSKKDELLSEIESIIAEAESDRDLGAMLKGVEMKAKLEALLNQKTTEEDRNVTINVITGITR